MKLVYVAHPFGGEDGNVDTVVDLIADLSGEYTDTTFVSPILMWGTMYDAISYKEGMDYCLELLSRCDELWLAGNWQTSKGCLCEYGYGKAANIPTFEVDYAGKLKEVAYCD